MSARGPKTVATDSDSARAGLCARCRHTQRVVSSRGSVFWLCGRSRLEPEYRKYPPLPVLRCAGWEPADVADDSAG